MISYSKIETFNRCTQQYKYKYIDSWKSEKNKFNLERGNALHEITEKILIGIEPKEPESYIEIIKASCLPEELEKNDVEREVPRIYDAANSLVSMIPDMKTELFEGIVPQLKTEENIRFPIYKRNGQLADIMTSYPDIHYWDQKKHLIIELKSTARTPSNEEASYSHIKQAIVYNKAMKAEYGKWMDDMEYWIIYAIFLKKEIKFLPLRIDFDNFPFVEDVEKEIWNSIRMIRDTEQKNSFCRVLNNQICSWCEFKRLCMEQSSDGLILDTKPTQAQYKLLDEMGLSAVGLTKKEVADLIDKKAFSKYGMYEKIMADSDME